MPMNEECYRAFAGEVAGGGRCARGRSEVTWAETRRVDEELIELVVSHL